ncbi:hypothetical protein MSIBF_A850007 [groundwater metagenome]|uniref:Uncharacterized protein n=1 Tax=groundwater metagenome TaxID=717931 RepID=A0A098EDD0_9ZZZZ
MYVAYEQKIYSLLTLQFHKFEKNAVCEVVKYIFILNNGKNIAFL